MWRSLYTESIATSPLTSLSAFYVLDRLPCPASGPVPSIRFSWLLVQPSCAGCVFPPSCPFAIPSVRLGLVNPTLTSIPPPQPSLYGRSGPLSFPLPSLLVFFLLPRQLPLCPCPHPPSDPCFYLPTCSRKSPPLPRLISRLFCL